MSVFKSFSRTTITTKSTEACIRYFADKGFSVYEEIGLKKGGNLRADVVAINLKGQIIITEVKSCWQDFASDNKWKNYLEFCNKFYFCIPKWLYESEKGEFIKNVCKENKVGLFIINYHDSEVAELDLEKNVSVRIYLANVVPAFKKPVSGKLRRWLITKLAWRGGLCAANLNPNKDGSPVLRQEYKFDSPLDETSFLYKLDTNEQKEYLKRFPSSSFKQRLRDPEVQQRIHRIRSAQTKKYEEGLNANDTKPKRRRRTVRR